VSAINFTKIHKVVCEISCLQKWLHTNTKTGPST